MICPMSPRKTKPKAPAELRDASRGVRLNKLLAEAGVASRRACDELIDELRVSVNGWTVTEMPVWVDPGADRVEVDGRPIGRKRRGHTYLMLNKPRNYICTNSDPEGRRRVFDLVPHTQRLFCVGRLDYDSTGLVLLTDDGALTQKLTHPSGEVPKTYRVTIKGRLEEQDIEQMKRGIYLGDRVRGGAVKARVERVKLIDRHHDRSRVEITLREGRNREIRRLLARLGHPVKKLVRTAVGPVKLKGVASGEWRELTRTELASLRRHASKAPTTPKRPKRSPAKKR